MAELRFIKTRDISSVCGYINEVLCSQLRNNKKILVLLSGSSSVKVAVELSKKLPKNLSEKIFVGLIDERYGEVGHDSSNWKDLDEQGFDFTKTTPCPVLVNLGETATAENYSEQIEEILSEVDFSFGLMGMGADGHTSGLLPNNPVMDSENLYEFYHGSDFRRITSTPKLLKSLDELVLYAVGENKIPVMSDLLGDNPKVVAKILFDSKKLTIFTDYKE